MLGPPGDPGMHLYSLRCLGHQGLRPRRGVGPREARTLRGLTGGSRWGASTGFVSRSRGPTSWQCRDGSAPRPRCAGG